MEKKKLIWIAIAVTIGVIISLIKPPAGLGQASMRFMGIFVAMIIVLIAQALADWVVSLLVLGIMILTHIDKMANIIITLGQSTVWLVFGVLALAAGIGNSGVIKRIAFKMLTLFPTTYKGTVLSMICTGTVLSPLISSTVAKATLLAPIGTSITERCGLKERSRGALGIFIATFIPAYYFGNVFISGSANVGIMMGFIKDIKFDYVGWMTAAFIWGLALLIGTYIFCITYCKPKEGEMGNISISMIKESLKEMGSMSSNEKYALGVLALALVGWITANWLGIDAGTVAVLAVGLLAARGLFTAEDLKKVPWPLLLFIAALLSVANEMSTLGVSTWIAKVMGPYLAPLLSSPWIFIPVLCIICYIIRLIVVSQFATLAIMIAIFGPLMSSVGMSVFVLVFVVYNSGATWNVKYQNPVPLAALAATGGKYVTFNEFRYGSYAYMIMNLIGLTASIPIWQMMGLIK